MENSFIKNLDILREDCRVDDQFDYSESLEKFRQFLKNLKYSCLVAFVGPFGCGKSTLLHQLHTAHEEAEKWIVFDAWKFPERNDLWEGFVLELADQIGDKNKIKKKIDGKSAKSKIVNIATDVMGAISEKLPDMNWLDKFTELFESSPAKRVFEIQNILSEMIEKQGIDLVVVIEDIDRSGDVGIYFLETLKQFIGNLKVNNQITIIVPMADDNYEKHLDSFLKCIDYVEFFQKKILNFDKFVEQVFAEELIANSNVKSQLSSFFEFLFERYSDFNIRKLKLILRKADIAYTRQVFDGHEPDFRVTFAIELSKYINVNNRGYPKYFGNYKGNKIIPRGDTIAIFLFVIMENGAKMWRGHNGERHSEEPYCDFKLIPRRDSKVHPSIPWKVNNGFVNDEKYFYVCDFYLNY